MSRVPVTYVILPNLGGLMITRLLFLGPGVISLIAQVIAFLESGSSFGDKVDPSKMRFGT